MSFHVPIVGLIRKPGGKGLGPGQVVILPGRPGHPPTLAVWLARDEDAGESFLVLSDAGELGPLEIYSAGPDEFVVGLGGVARLEVDPTAPLHDDGAHGSFALSGQLFVSLPAAGPGRRGRVPLDPVRWAPTDSPSWAGGHTYGWRIVLDDGNERAEPIVLAKGQPRTLRQA